MNLDHPGRLIAVAIVLLIVGFAVPFLMALRVVESTFLLNFVSFAASVLGLFLGIAGITVYQGRQKRKDDDEDRYR